MPKIDFNKKIITDLRALNYCQLAIQQNLRLEFNVNISILCLTTKIVSTPPL